MRRLVAAVCLVVVASSARAQINPQSMTISAVSDCLREAIATSAVEENGNALMFSCTAAKARVLYNLLGRKMRAEIVQDRSGKFENRQFGNGACYHRVADQTGKAADDFRCDLVMVIGDVLRD